MNKLKKIILTTTLCLVLAVSSPLTVFAQEAGGAGEASGAAEAGSAQEASTAPGAAPAPEADVSPTPSPSPSPDITTEQTSQTVDYDWDADEVDEDDLNLDGDEWVSSGTNSSGNVGDTEISTGNASASGSVITNANSTAIADNGNCTVCVDDVNVKNSGNGAGSNNSADVDLNSNSTVTINNDADVSNNLNLDADSGNNAASYNVGNSDITTGDANVSGVVITSANETGLGVVEYNILEDHLGDIILAVPDGLFGCGLCGPAGDVSVENTGNGTESTNSAAVEVDNSSDTTINNDANVVNNLYLDANSGDNETSYNTGGDSSITTGDANAAANLLNFVNSTIDGGVAFIVNVFGDLVGDIIFPDNLPLIGSISVGAANIGNGADSDNNIDINSTNTQNTALNNLATIDNVISIDANTGENDTKYNTGGDNSIETGDVFVNAEVLNVVNTNLLGASDEPLWLILVNNMGTWTGQIIGALTGTNYSGSDGLAFTVDENGEVVATNAGNGAGSTNDIDITQSNTDNLTVNNTANITNNVNIKANTGGNSASYNTGGDSSIETGDANVAASIMNFVNTNLIGRTLMLGIINVFGSWTGDAVPPGYDPVADSTSASSQSVGGASNGSSSGGSSSGSGSSSVAGIGGAIISALTSNNSSGSSSGTGFGLFGGSGGSGGTIDDDQNAVTVDEGAPSILGDGAKAKDGIISLTFNWKMLLFALIPLLTFGFYRARMLTNIRRRESAVAHEIKVGKKR